MEIDVKYELQNILNQGIADVKSGAIPLNTIFDRPAGELTKISNYLTKTMIKVILADPRENADLPCFTILRSNDAEAEQAIGNYLDDDEDIPAVEDDPNTIPNEESPAKTKVRYGTDFNIVASVEIWTENPDVREFLYKIAKEILFKNREYLNGKGLMEQTMSGSDQSGVLSQYFPEHVYVATLSITGKNMMHQFKTSNKIKDDFKTTIEPIV